MARGVNKVILIGHLGKDPVISYADDGSEIAQFSLATTQSWKDKQTGEARERTEWHRIVIFGPLAKVASQYLRKGSKAYLEGYLQTRKWQDQVGLDHYTTEIILDAYDGKMQLLDSARNEPPLHGHIEKPSASSTTPGSSGEIGHGDEEPINDKIESTTIPPSDITPQD